MCLKNSYMYKYSCTGIRDYLRKASLHYVVWLQVATKNKVFNFTILFLILLLRTEIQFLNSYLYIMNVKKKYLKNDKLF